MKEQQVNELQNQPFTLMLTKSEKQLLKLKAFESSCTMAQLTRNIIFNCLTVKK